MAEFLVYDTDENGNAIGRGVFVTADTAKDAGESRTLKVTTVAHKGLQMPPHYHGYQSGTFDNVNYCEDCDMHALYEDMHTVDPCPNCGGAVVSNEKVGKWIETKPSSGGFLREYVSSEGYWAIKTEAE